jgi:predicted SAM-dependent methyltransferase
LGGKGHCNPHSRYSKYVSVDLVSGEGWRIAHNICEPIPLPDESVDQFHSEDLLHLLKQDDFETVIAECHRLLKPGCRFRFSVPDYKNPKDRDRVQNGRDPNYPLHLTFTTKPLLEEMLARSPFAQYEFYHYWDGDSFIQNPIDYNLGWINRTPDNDSRCHRIRPKGYVKNFLFMLKHGFRLTKLEKQTCLEGGPLRITSLVVDCIK